ncbi:RNA polymerase sigma factor FliA [Ferrimonas lipolytica]|uniref:RNA polymerase sigma factor FliA n=1 Tax=Ferrimonas lipolytica TaxID=2724191 RepID=A0A6H1UF08_9GAMM|nr:RNA polymerase sigma factor FliA [Ferrimonas lipolytica]QIZ76796.1 RNA polymerase sigma factor FliA [Ferrimonas lipolytica]
MFSGAHDYSANTTSSAINEQAVLQQYLPLVKRTASKLACHCDGVLDRDDLEQLGLMALLDIVRRYPGEIDNNFAAVASKRVRGAMLDEFRRLDWRSRQVRQSAHQYNDAQRELTKKLVRQPSQQEIADHLGLSLTEVHQSCLDSHADVLSSLDELLENHEPSQGDDDHNEQQEMLVHGLSKLNQRQQLLMSLYYQHELNLKEIALVLKVTEARVCQLHKAAVIALRKVILELKQ